jgi:holo-[acyl-carrier protein] synthase
MHCGVDIIEIDRIKKILDSKTTGLSFINKVFTSSETAYCESKRSSKYQSYAARFAAKEAVSKALGTGIGSGVAWRDIEVLNNSAGQPYISLTGCAKEVFTNLRGTCISISLSHSDNLAVAFAVIQTDLLS